MPPRSRRKIVDDDVVHMGILALGMERGIDFDSETSAVKAIFLRKEQRDAARDVVDAVEESMTSCLTGSPGSGKTFGTMAAIVAELLRRGRPVLRVSSKPGRAVLFSPRDDGGGIEAWAAILGSRCFGESGLCDDRAVCAVVNPPEGGFEANVLGLRCDVILVPPDDKKQLKGWEPVYYTDPPTPDECLLMCRSMWSPASFKPGTTDQEIDEEIRSRMVLVGPFPRYLVDWTKFRLRVAEIIAETNCLPRDPSRPDLLRAILNRDADVGESGLLKVTYVRRQGPVVRRRTYERKINDLVAYLLQRVAPWNLVNNVETVFAQGDSAARDVGRDVGESLLRSGGSFNVAELVIVGGEEANTSLVSGEAFVAEFPKCEDSSDAAFIVECGSLLRMPTSVMDLVSNRFVLFNSKTTTSINATTGLSFLRKLGVVQLRNTWDTVEGQDHFQCTVYFAGIEKNLRSPLMVEGPKDERDLLLKHVKMRRLHLSREDLRGRINQKISAALRDNGFRDDIIKPENITESHAAWYFFSGRRR